MVQSISKVAGFKGTADIKPIQPETGRSFVRGGPAAVAAPNSSSVQASQNAEAKKIQALFVEVNPGRAHSMHSAEFMLNGKPATISGTKDELTIAGENFEMKIDHGELSSATGLPGELMRYRTLLMVDDALQKLVKKPGIWPAAAPAPAAPVASAPSVPVPGR